MGQEQTGEYRLQLPHPRPEAHNAWLEQESTDSDRDPRQALFQSVVWREKGNLLRTRPGVGEQPSLTALAYVPELGALPGSRANVGFRHFVGVHQERRGG